MLRYDLRTGAKSHLHLYENFDLCGRYDYKTKIDPYQALDFIIKDLFWEFKACLRGRDYYNSEWMKLGVKLGLVEKKTTMSTSYV